MERTLHMLAIDLKSTDFKLVLCSLNLLSCIFSGYLLCKTGARVMCDSLLECISVVVHLLNGSNYECTLMCLFVVSTSTVSKAFEYCAAELVQVLCNIWFSPASHHKPDKLKCWTLRALIRIQSRHHSTIRCESNHYHAMCTSVFHATSTAVRDPKVLSAAVKHLTHINSNNSSSSNTSTTTNSDESEHSKLILLQLEFLLTVPVGVGHLKAALPEALQYTAEIATSIRYLLFHLFV